MSISANIDGKSLLKTLGALPKNIQNNVMSGAIRSSANVIRDEAKRLAPVDKGALKKGIKTVKRSARNGEYRFTVTTGRSGWYAHFIEFGTVKMSAKPFMRPAMEQTQDESLNAAKEYIAKRIPEEIMRSKQ